jgi:hypothetical protein
MIDIDNTDDFPKLVPDTNIRFDAKDEIRRSPEMDFECSELEYKCTVAEEELAMKYNIRLMPNTAMVMPDKSSLKHKTSKPRRLLWLSFAAAVAIVAFAVIISKNKSANTPTVVIMPASKPKSDIIVETKPEPKLKPKIIVDKPVTNKASIPVRKTAVTAKKTVSGTVDAETAKQDTLAETAKNRDDIPRPKNVRIERIAAVFVPVEMMSREKTVFVYQQNYRQTAVFKTINSIASAAGKLVTDVHDAKQNITQMFDDFRLPNILSRLSLDRGIDREIDEWAKSNPNIPFTVFIDYSSENKMSEIYDETGTLVKVIFFTNKSLKYRNQKTYHASNNFK